MFRNFTKLKYNNLWHQSTHMEYATYLPKPPRKPDDNLIMGVLLGGIGISSGWNLWLDKKDSQIKYMSDNKMLASVLTGTSLAGSVIYIIKYIRR